MGRRSSIGHLLKYELIVMWLVKTRLPNVLIFRSTENMKNYLNIFALVISLAINLGCSKKTDFNGSSSSSSDGSGAGDTQPAKNFLWVHHKSVSGALRYTHKTVTTGTWPDQCKVDLDSTNIADRDIMCITESTELDLIHQGLTLEYNVPAHEKCPYVTTMAPFFFRWEPPRDDSVHLEPVYVFVDDDQQAGTYTAAAYYDLAGTIPNPNFSYKKGSYKCGFNYSDVNGPNCCEGKYSEAVKTTSVDPSSGTVTTTYTSSEMDWNGDRSSCLDGPALKLNPNLDGKSNWPTPIIWRMKEQVGGGTALMSKTSLASPIELFAQFKTFAEDTTPVEKKNFGTFEIKSLLDQGYSTTRPLATYYSNASIPKAFNDILDYSPNKDLYSLYGDPRYFSVLCTNYAFEVTARIRVAVREWNTYPALQAATEPTANEDDNNDLEPDWPPAYPYPNGDFLDWEDSGGWMSSGFNTYPGPYL